MTAEHVEHRLTDPAEELYRQVHPKFFEDGEPSSQAFKPMGDDNGQLSVARSSLTTAEQSFVLHTEQKGLNSVGVWAVMVAEVENEPAGLSAYGDPVTEPVPDPAHAYIEFGDLPRRQVEFRAKVLLAAARARGCCYPVTASATTPRRRP